MSSEPYSVSLLRHGKPVGNLENRFQGLADFPLTGTGHSQTRALVQRWLVEGRIFDRIISSSLVRARETSEILYEVLKSSLEIDPNWVEIDNGLLAGIRNEEPAQSISRPVFINPYTHTSITGESRWEIYLRAGRNVQRLLDQPVWYTLVVAHGGILNMTMYAILGIPVQADHTGPRFMSHNTTFATFTYDPNHHKWRLLYFDNHQHWMAN
jgi:2,3-bisphosphoglycerate-dependent phosphoglycerate mutase